MTQPYKSIMLSWLGRSHTGMELWLLPSLVRATSTCRCDLRSLRSSQRHSKGCALTAGTVPPLAGRSSSVVTPRVTCGRLRLRLIPTESRGHGVDYGPGDA